MKKSFSTARVAGIAVALSFLLAACGGSDAPTAEAVTPPREILAIKTVTIAKFDSPWAMAALPDGRVLVTENLVPARLTIVGQDGKVSQPLAGVPEGRGFFDVVLHPKYATNKLVFLSFAERGGPDEPRVGRMADDMSQSPSGLAVASATLVLDAQGGGGRLENTQVIWRQVPKIVSGGQYGGRMAFSPDGKYVFVTAGDRQEFFPVQQLSNTLGKTVRLLVDGSVPVDNPFSTIAGARADIWSYGHRNYYGISFTPDGVLWSHEMGPMGGDELNIIRPGMNYGWPMVSNGSHYDGGVIPDHAPGDGYAAPVISWTPVIAPAGMLIYAGRMFADWRGDAIVTGLRSNGLVRIRFNGETAKEVQRLDLGVRVRDIEQAPDGALWILEDAPTGLLLRAMPQ